MTKFHYYVLVGFLSAILAKLTFGWVAWLFIINIYISCICALVWSWKNKDLEV